MNIIIKYVADLVYKDPNDSNLIVSKKCNVRHAIDTDTMKSAYFDFNPIDEPGRWFYSASREFKLL